MASTAAPDGKIRPLYHVLVVYEGVYKDIESLKGLQSSKVGWLEPHCIEADFLGTENSVVKSCEKYSGLTERIKTMTNRKDGGSYPPIIFIGLGFGALVTMNAVISEKLTPMGVVVSSVSPDWTTGQSIKFKTWYNNLIKPENPDLGDLKRVLCKFNNYCRSERVRFSYVFHQREESNNESISS